MDVDDCAGVEARGTNQRDHTPAPEIPQRVGGVAADAQLPAQAPRSRATAPAAVKPKKKRAIKALAITWEVQRAGLPEEERAQLRALFGKKKRGRATDATAQPGARDADGAPRPAATDAQPEQPAQPAQPAQQPTQPKRSHHKKSGDALAIHLPLEWERVDKRLQRSDADGALNGPYGIRKRLPKTVRDAASKTVGGRGQKIEFRQTPKILAWNSYWSEKFSWWPKKEIITKDNDTGAARLISNTRTTRARARVREPHAYT